MAALPISLPDLELSTVQWEAIAALAMGQTILAAAGQTGVHRATVHNWLKMPAFSVALDQARQDHADDIRAKLSQAAELAIDTIRHILTDPNASPAVKLRAALAVLDRPLFPKPDVAPTQEAPTEVPATPPAPTATASSPSAAVPSRPRRGSGFRRWLGPQPATAD